MTRGDDVAHAGGSIAYGCVQEEIMFACHPELNCARLVFTPMLANEAFILCGAEQFAMPRGYAFGLECAGPYHPVACMSTFCCLSCILRALHAFVLASSIIRRLVGTQKLHVRVSGSEI